MNLDFLTTIKWVFTRISCTPTSFVEVSWNPRFIVSVMNSSFTLCWHNAFWRSFKRPVVIILIVYGIIDCDVKKWKSDIVHTSNLTFAVKGTNDRRVNVFSILLDTFMGLFFYIYVTRQLTVDLLFSLSGFFCFPLGPISTNTALLRLCHFEVVQFSYFYVV